MGIRFVDPTIIRIIVAFLICLWYILWHFRKGFYLKYVLVAFLKLFHIGIFLSFYHNHMLISLHELVLWILVSFFGFRNTFAVVSSFTSIGFSVSLFCFCFFGFFCRMITQILPYRIYCLFSWCILQQNWFPNIFHWMHL